MADPANGGPDMWYTREKERTMYHHVVKFSRTNIIYYSVIIRLTRSECQPPAQIITYTVLKALLEHFAQQDLGDPQPEELVSRRC